MSELDGSVEGTMSKAQAARRDSRAVPNHILSLPTHWKR
jgi:hypothetical protein